MKKKILALMLSGLMLLSLGLTGCGKSTTSGNNEDNNKQTASEEKGEEKKSNFPNKPIQIICPVKAGGDTDYNTRVLATYLEKYLGTSVVVTNVDGGATVMGMQQVLSAPADGYTMVINGLDAYIPKLMGTTDIDIDSFKTVGIPLFDNCTVLVTNKNSGYGDLKDLVEDTKANPNKIEYGMKIGAANQIYGVAMNAEWDAKFKMMDVGNNAAKMTALLGEQTDSVILTYALAKDYFESGEFQALCLLGSEKNELLPNIPMPSDYGYENIDCSKWFWLGVHPDTPEDIVNVLAEALEKVTQDKEYIEKMEDNYLTVKYIGKEEGHEFANEFYKKNILPYKDEFLSQQ